MRGWLTPLPMAENTVPPVRILTSGQDPSDFGATGARG